MKFHKQLIVDPSRGDCVRTCVACVLDLEVMDVPNFTDMNLEDPSKDMWDHMTIWLRSQGYCMVKLQAEGRQGSSHFPGLDLHLLGGALCLGSVPSQRFHSGSHSVVCQVQRYKTEQCTYSKVEIIHDPSPGNGPYPWYADVTSLTFLVKSWADHFPSARQQYGVAA